MPIRPALTVLTIAAAMAFAMTGHPVTASSSAEPPPIPGGHIGTLPTGYYGCEKPEAGTTLAVQQIGDLTFEVVNGSSYMARGKRGSYLLTGNDLVMTGGALQGLAFKRAGSKLLRLVGDDGKPGEIRCTLRGRHKPATRNPDAAKVSKGPASPD